MTKDDIVACTKCYRIVHPKPMVNPLTKEIMPKVFCCPHCGYELPDFDKPSKCKNCGKPKGFHKAITLNCPFGRKHRVLGYTSFYPTQVFEEKESKDGKR